LVPGGEHLIKNTNWGAQYRLWPIGDIHWGARGCAEQLVDATLRRIEQDPKALWIGCGDYFDLISPRDKRWDPENIDPRHRAAFFKRMGGEMITYGAQKLAPIRKKCLGLLEGNHEFSYSQQVDRAMCRDLADELKVPFLGYSCFKDLVFQKGKRTLRVRIMAHHGAGSAQTVGGKINKLKSFMQSVDADIVLMGHVHIAGDLQMVELKANDNCSDLGANIKLGVISGTYLKTYEANKDGASSYGERRGYEPVPLGSPCVIIEPGPGRVLVEKPVGHLSRR